jgi:hypothetical protein
MSLWKRFRNFPRWAQILICTAVMSVGVAGASSQGSKSTEQAGRTTGTTATTTTVTTAVAPGDGTSSTGEASAESTTTTVGGTSTTAATGSTATTAPRPTTTTKPTATTTTTRPAPAGDPTAVLAGLRVAPEGARAGYDRGLFNHWVDEDGDSCDTREEVLIAESRSRAQVDPYGCKVVAGDWFSAYDGLTFSDPSELDVDHVVALAEAWDSGASGWDASRRRAFANDLGHPEALVAVSASSNRSKSDLDPGQWKPTRDAAWCQYARDWVTVKKAWDLSADQNEVDDLKVMLRTCNDTAPGGGAPAPTASSTTTTTTSPPTGGTITVAGLDCQGETVTVRNGGSAPADLTGWSIHDEGIKHTYRFPAGYTLAPGASVTIRSDGAAGPGELGWTNSPVWNNDGDSAHLLNAGGTVVSTRPC